MLERFTADQSRANSIKNVDKKHQLIMADIYKIIREKSEQDAERYIVLWRELTTRIEQELLKDGYQLETTDGDEVLIKW